MEASSPTRRKRPRTPPGLEGHLTRRQAAQLLGFASEFKIRQLERQGRLRSVRGLMRTAFYAKADVLAVKAELTQLNPAQQADDDWTDAELVALLGHRTAEGRARTALDLVLEAHLSIERAERVFAFWTRNHAVVTAASSPGPEPAPAPASRPFLSHAPGERRSDARLSRDAIIAELRHPDPRVREQAFARLKNGQDS
jgi:hypothetical protein